VTAATAATEETPVKGTSPDAAAAVDFELVMDVPTTAAAATAAVSAPVTVKEKFALNKDKPAGAYTRPHFSSTSAILVTPLLGPLSNRLGENHVPDMSHKMC
jgi:hypothetical protein